MNNRRVDLARISEAEACSRRRRASAGIGCESLEGRQLLSTLRQDVRQLAVDLYQVHQGSNVTSAELKAVASDVKAIAAVATKPDPTTVATLETDLKAALADGTVSAAEGIMLKNDISAVLTSANIPKSLAQQTASDIKVVITASGVTQDDVQLIVGDVKTILNDLRSMKR